MWGFFKSKKKSRSQLIRESSEMAAAKRRCREENKKFYNSKYPVCEKCSASKDHFLPWKQRQHHVAHWWALSRFPMIATCQWNLLILCDHHNYAQKTSTGLPWKHINRFSLLWIFKPVFRVLMWAKTGVW